MNKTEVNEDLDFDWYIKVIFRSFGLIAGMVILGLVCAICVNIFMRPVYSAGVLLMIEKEQAGKIDAISFGSFATEEDYYRTQYKLLESRTLLEKVYKNMDLNQYEEFAAPGGLAKLKKALKIEPITRSRLVNVSAASYDPKLAADIANTLTRTFVADNVINRISMAQDVIRALESTQKSQEEVELLNSMPQVVNSDFIKNLKIQKAGISDQKAKLSAKYTASHPDIISLDRQMTATERIIDIETMRLIQSIKIELSGQFSGNNIRIIDAAVTPSTPARPNKMLNLLIGLAAGGALGLMFVFLMEFWDQSIRTAEDLAAKLNLPFLGFVPFEKIQKNKPEYSTMLQEGHLLMPENVRNIRTMLDFALEGDVNAPLLITSSLQGEGKSHLSTNLAVALAQTGKKVLLVDGDLRRSRLHRAFHLANDKGLSNIWSPDSEKAAYKYNIQPVKDVKNLSVMTAGKRPPNPTELLNTPKLKDFIAWAKTNYDQLIIDCPAIMPLSDTLLWGRYINKAVFVVKYGKTSSKIAQHAMDKLKKAGITVLGAVIGHYRKQALSYGKYAYYYQEDKKD